MYIDDMTLRTSSHSCLPRRTPRQLRAMFSEPRRPGAEPQSSVSPVCDTALTIIGSDVPADLAYQYRIRFRRATCPGIWIDSLCPDPTAFSILLGAPLRPKPPNSHAPPPPQATVTPCLLTIASRPPGAPVATVPDLQPTFVTR
ncbi:hypothetical protein J6590_041660 [Homalodisca vitripennis]|nr:hypothetical protein J6590_041660 [Homalodisca vitripennis]